MSDVIRLTTSDYYMLQAFMLAGAGGDESIARTLARKLSRAIVTSPQAIAPLVVRTGSIVRFTIDAVGAEERVLVSGPSHLLQCEALELMTARGVAIVGMSCGAGVDVDRDRGAPEHIVIDEVRLASDRWRAPQRSRDSSPSAGVTQFHQPGRTRRPSAAVPFVYDDDPGPFAA